MPGALLREHTRTRVVLALIFAGLVAVGLWAWTGHRDVLAGEETLVLRRDLSIRETLAAHVMPTSDGQGVLRVPRGALVSQVLVRVGDKVWKQDPLVRLYARGYEGWLSLADAEKRDADRAYSAARASLERYLSDVRVRLAKARALEKQLRAAGPAKAKALFEAVQSRQRLQLELRSAMAGRDRFLSPFKERAYRAGERVKDAEFGLPTANLVAPCDGIVQEVRVKPRQLVKGEDAIVRIVDPWSLVLVADLTPEQAVRIRAGMKAEVALDGRDSIPAKVATVEVDLAHRIAHGGTRYVAVLDLGDAPIRLSLEQKAEVSVTLASVSDALSVAGGVIHPGADGKAAATVMRGGSWRTVPVEVGLSDGHYVEIRSGLRESETVLIPR